MPHDVNTDQPPAAAQGRLDLLYVCAVLATCAVVLTALAWSHPTKKGSELRYAQTGALSYSASATAGSIYGPAGLTSGEPIYVSAVGPIRVSYHYRFETTAAAEISGTEQLVAVMNNGQGISRSTTLQEVTSFRGPSFVATGTLNPAWVQATAKSFDETPGSVARGLYTLTISPAVHVHGRVAGTPVVASLNKLATFTFNGTALTVNATPTSGAPAGTPSATSQAGAPPGPTSDLAVDVPGSVSVPNSAAATLFGAVPVAGARIAGPLALVLAVLIGSLFGGRLLRQATSDDERVRITARHGSSLIGVTSLPGHPDVVVVELSSFEGLMQVARKLDCPLLHRRGSEDAFAVVDNGTLYRYEARIPGTPTTAAVQPLETSSNGRVSPRPEPAL